MIKRASGEVIIFRARMSSAPPFARRVALQSLRPRLQRFVHLVANGDGDSILARSGLLDGAGANDASCEIAAAFIEAYAAIAANGGGTVSYDGDSPLLKQYYMLPLVDRALLALVIVERIDYDLAARVVGVSRRDAQLKMAKARRALIAS